MVEYNLEKLQRYLSVSGRTLNDLRSLRREEMPATDGTKHHQVATTLRLAGAISTSELPLGKTQSLHSLRNVATFQPLIAESPPHLRSGSN